MTDVNKTHELRLTRIFSARPADVFKAWTDAKKLGVWWGPKMFTNPVAEIDARPGGAIRIHMKGPDGIIYPMTGTIKEVSLPNRLVFTSNALDNKDRPMFEVLNEVGFAEHQGGTKLTLHATVSAATAVAPQYLEGMEAGWSQSFDKLADMLSGGKEMVIERSFDAPASMVWDAFTKAEHMKHWWGPQGSTIKVAKLELKPGGIFHYSMSSADGKEIWGKFTYKDISAPNSLEFVNSFSDAQGGVTRNPWMPTWPLEVHNVLSLYEFQGKATVTLRGSPINADAEGLKAFEAGRDGMRKGFEGTWSQLDEYLKKMERYDLQDKSCKLATEKLRPGKADVVC